MDVHMYSSRQIQPATPACGARVSVRTLGFTLTAFYCVLPSEHRIAMDA